MSASLTFKQMAMILTASPEADDVRAAFISAIMGRLPEQPRNADVSEVLNSPAPALSSFGNSAGADSAPVKPSAVREPRTAGSDPETANIARTARPRVPLSEETHNAATSNHARR
jgi:hypothetical protein